MRNSFLLPSSQNPCESMKSVVQRPSPRQVENSSEGRSIFVLRRTARTLSRPAHAGFRERRTAPFRVCAKRPTHCHLAACGRDHESRRRRAPPTTNAPCGRREICPVSHRDTKALRPALDLQDDLTPNGLGARDCPRINTNFTNLN